MSLKLFPQRSAQNRLSERLEQVQFEIAKPESEASLLTDEMEALESSAIQIENAVKSLFTQEILQDELFLRRAETLSIKEFADLTFKMSGG